MIPPGEHGFAVANLPPKFGSPNSPAVRRVIHDARPGRELASGVVVPAEQLGADQHRLQREPHGLVDRIRLDAIRVVDVAVPAGVGEVEHAVGLGAGPANRLGHLFETQRALRRKTIGSWSS